jgi:biopolymer transport protein ExbD
MNLLPWTLGSIGCALILSLVGILPASRSVANRHGRPVDLAVMSYGKKISVEQWMCVVTVDHQRRWFIDGHEITTREMLHAHLTDARKRQHAQFKYAYIRCRIDQRCPARDFLDLYAAAGESGFDRIVIAGVL